MGPGPPRRHSSGGTSTQSPTCFASPHTTREGDGCTGGHTQEGAHYLAVKVVQAPGAAAQYHPGRRGIEGDVHTGPSFPQTSGGEALPTNSVRVR